MFACTAPNSDDPAADTATDGQAAVGGEPEAVARWNGGSEDPDDPGAATVDAPALPQPPLAPAPLAPAPPAVVPHWDGGGWDPDGETITVHDDGGWLPRWDSPFGWAYHRHSEPASGDGSCYGSCGGGQMDPEPDQNKDYNSCFDWCQWNRRQCGKECRHKYPYPRWDEYNQCIKERCENHEDPKIGRRSCEADCRSKFPDRPITATWQSL